MRRKFWLLLILVCLLALPLAPVWAGGWATITLDAWPEDVAAGEKLEIGFVVRQHGRDDQRMNGLSPTVSIRNPETGENDRFVAQQVGEPGHYVAAVIFPSAGVWDWTVAAFSVEQPLPELTVLDPAGFSPVEDTPARLPVLAGGLGLALLVAAAIFGRRQRTRWALLLAVAGLAAAGAGLASAAADREAPQARAADAPVVAQAGETLFVAKGCVQCHRNDRVDRDLVVFSTEVGPDLTNYQASAEYLRVWLKDPQTAKPQTQMPNLGLSEVEMEALIAFLSHKP